MRKSTPRLTCFAATAQPRDASSTALWGLQFALSLCRSERHLQEWHRRNERVFELLNDAHKDRLRAAYRVKLAELKGK